MSQNRGNLAEGISAFRYDVGLSAIVEIPAVPGQLGMTIRRVNGGTMEIGGASLTWGTGHICSNTEVGTGSIIPITDSIYVAASGATVEITGYYYYSEGNPGNLG